MRQFILPVEYPGNRLTLTGTDSHYLIQVLRMKTGDTFTARTKAGIQYTARIDKIFSNNCEIILKPRPMEKKIPNTTKIVLVQALPKGKKMDLIVRQAVECGVSKIIPIVSEYSVVRIKAGKESEKAERWKKIVKEAVQQSGTAIFPEITPVACIEEIPAAKGTDSLGLFFHPTPLENYTLHRYLSSNKKSLYLCIGPEGGFSEKEIDIFSSKGYKPIFLGKNVLRTETAAVYALGAVRTLIMEQRAWKAIR